METVFPYAAAFVVPRPGEWLAVPGQGVRCFDYPL